MWGKDFNLKNTHRYLQCINRWMPACREIISMTSFGDERLGILLHNTENNSRERKRDREMNRQLTNPTNPLKHKKTRAILFLLYDSH